jgi:hypothetical protein
MPGLQAKAEEARSQVTHATKHDEVRANPEFRRLLEDLASVRSECEWLRSAYRARDARDEAVLAGFTAYVESVARERDLANAMAEKAIARMGYERERLEAERDEARANYQWMVERAADGANGNPSLDAYRELAAQVAAAEDAVAEERTPGALTRPPA